jgi:hypothetical protein
VFLLYQVDDEEQILNGEMQQYGTDNLCCNEGRGCGNARQLRKAMPELQGDLRMAYAEVLRVEHV